MKVDAECVWDVPETSKSKCITVKTQQPAMLFEIEPETAEKIKKKIAEEKPVYLYFAGEGGILKFEVARISFSGNVMKAYPIRFC